MSAASPKGGGGTIEKGNMAATDKVTGAVLETPELRAAGMLLHYRLRLKNCAATPL
jgi:hypothetical protein